MEQSAVWTWFHDPRAVHRDGRTYVTWHQGDGIWVGERHDGWNTFRLTRTEDANDDHVAVLGVRVDRRLIACYAEHNRPMRTRITSRPADVTSWDAERTIDDGGCTYPNLVYLAVERRWYLFYRRTVHRKHKPIVMRTSDDGGASWSPATVVFDVPGHRPYFKIATNSIDRIDIAVTDGHPNEYADNSVYHFAYNVGVWTDSHGGALGPPPFSTEAVTVVYDATVHHPAWVWDIAPGPVIAFATFPTLKYHRYQLARWTGERWTVHEVAVGGGTIDTTGTEHHYSGGLVLDHERPDTMVASVQIGAGWSVLRFTVSPIGEISDVDVLTKAAGKHVRPVVARGSSEVFWLAGSYDGYRRFSTQLMSSLPGFHG